MRTVADDFVRACPPLAAIVRVVADDEGTPEELVGRERLVADEDDGPPDADVGRAAAAAAAGLFLVVIGGRLVAVEDAADALPWGCCRTGAARPKMPEVGLLFAVAPVEELPPFPLPFPPAPVVLAACGAALELGGPFTGSRLGDAFRRSSRDRLASLSFNPLFPGLRSDRARVREVEDDMVVGID